MKGPFTRVTDTKDGTAYNYTQFYEYSRWFRSDTVPYDKPLPYLHHKHFWVEPKAPNPFLNHPATTAAGASFLYSGFNSGGPGSMELVHNRAYARFVGKVSSGLQLGVSLAELGQTRKLIGGILTGLLNPVKVLAEAFHRYARHSGKPYSWVAKNVALRDIPGAWLAFHFGVEPLVNDLHSAFDAYLLKHPAMFYSASAKGAWSHRVEPNPAQYSHYDHKYDFEAVARVAGRVSFKETPMATLAEVGLINPLSVAWELVPYSFVVDWFYPVGQLIDSMTDLFHVNVTDCYQSWLLKCKSQYRYYNGAYRQQWRNHSSMRFERRLLAAPIMHAPPFRVPGSFSKVRLATGLSLILNAFSPGHSRIPLH